MVSGLKLKGVTISKEGSTYFEIMNRESTQKLLLRIARRIASRADGAGYTVRADIRPGRKRAHARATVYLTNPQSFKDMYHNRKWKSIARQNLLSAFDSECE